MANKIFDNAKKAKEDEFYTQLADIGEELTNYTGQFKGKTVLCNCDDPRVSNFFYYFFVKFHSLGLKRLIATCYKNLNPDLFSQNQDKQAVYCIYDGKGRADDVFEDRDTFIKQNNWDILKGDGDFRSKECIALLQQADIVVTNPPFSLFREYVTQLIEHGKQFLIIGNKNCITYKEIFKYIKENRIWLGYRNINSDIWFQLPDNSKNWEKEENGKKLKHISACWFTNLDHKKHHEDLILTERYDPIKFPAYDNYGAINVDKVADIPMDYDGVMGVPITFLDKYNPDQFEIVDGLNRYSTLDVAGTNKWAQDNHLHMTCINGKCTYYRILIRNRKPYKENKQ